MKEGDIRVTIIQSDIHWQDINKNLDDFTSKIDHISQPTDIIVLPEMFTTAFTLNPSELAESMEGQAIEWMKKMARIKNAAITGSIIILNEGKYYNRLLFIKPDSEPEFYDKRHLFRMSGEDRYYANGNKRLVVEHKNWRICPLVCYDLRFPVWSRNQSDYDILIYVANWPHSRQYAWRSLLIARAIENQCYVVGVNRIGKDGNGNFYSGDSMVINPLGAIISETSQYENSTETVELSLDFMNDFRKAFPAHLDADQFKIIKD